MSNSNTPSPGCNWLVGYAYVPIQVADDRNLYDPETGLTRGTIFPTLDLPLGVYGRQVREAKEGCRHV